MLTYWKRTREMDDNTLIKKAYMENVENNSEWCQTIQVLNCSQNLHSGHIPDSKFPGIARKNIHDNFVKFWQQGIRNQPKLEVYRLIKQEFTISKYLELPEFRDRQRIKKFITSNHCLEIEKARHQKEQVDRAERICRACDQETIEDEHHFLVTCPVYHEVRAAHLSHIPTAGDRNRQIQEIFTANSPADITQVLKAAFDLRDKLVNFQVTRLSLCAMRMTISRGAGSRQTKLTTKLQAEISGPSKVKIMRKRKRYAPYQYTC